MNNKLEAFARNYLKENLVKCTTEEQKMFKRMYSHNNLEKPINEIVDELHVAKLDNAMKQIERTLAKKDEDAQPPKFLKTNVEGLEFKIAEDGVWLCVEHKRQHCMVNLNNLSNDEKESGKRLTSPFTLLRNLVLDSASTIV